MANDGVYSQTWGAGNFDPHDLEEFGDDATVEYVEHLGEDFYAVETDAGRAFIRHGDSETTFFGDRSSVNRSLHQFKKDLGAYKRFNNGVEEEYSPSVETAQASIEALEEFGLEIVPVAAEGGEIMEPEEEEKENYGNMEDVEHDPTERTGSGNPSL